MLKSLPWLRAVIAVCLLSCCSSTARFKVQGRVAHQPIETLVDSALARDYVEMLNGTALDTQATGTIRALLSRFDSRPLESDSLSELAKLSSPDFASLYFAERVTREHGELKRRFVEYTDTPQPIPNALTADVLAVFVPGLFYQSHPETKGDLVDAEGEVRRVGLATDRVQTLDAGSVEENAELIARFLNGYPKRNVRFVLVSASAGGPEVLAALGQLNAETSRCVVAWVSIGGVLRGSALADAWLQVPRTWGASLLARLFGYSNDLVASLGTARSSVRFARARLAPNLKVLHYVGAPLSGTVSEVVRDEHRFLNQFGPNDGITLLGDELLPGGYVVVDLGLDHRFVHPHIANKTAALTRIVLELLATRSDVANAQ